MNKARFSLLTLLLLFANALMAMEGTKQPKIPFSLVDVFAKAREETRALSLDRKVRFAEAMDESNEFEALLAAEQPARVKMAFEAVTNLYSETTERTTKEWRRTLAPRTGAATAACCLLSCLKPYLCGLLDGVPTEEMTIGLFGFWNGRVYELQPLRIASNNEATLAKIAIAKASQITEEKIKIIAAQQQKDKELDELLEQVLDDTGKEEREKSAAQIEAGVESATLAAQQTPELTLEEKKNQ